MIRRLKYTALLLAIVMLANGMLCSVHSPFMESRNHLKDLITSLKDLSSGLEETPLFQDNFKNTVTSIRIAVELDRKIEPAQSGDNLPNPIQLFLVSDHTDHFSLIHCATLKDIPDNYLTHNPTPPLPPPQAFSSAASSSSSRIINTFSDSGLLLIVSSRTETILKGLIYA